MAPSKPTKPRQKLVDVYNSTSTGHQVGSGVSKPTAYNKSRSAKLQQQFRSNQAPLTAFLTSAKAAVPGSFAAPNKGAVADLATSSTDQSFKTSALSASAPKPTRNIFAGCSIYINGSTAPQISDVELKRLLSHHGARVSMTLARKTTTHVIISDMGGGLAAGKLQKEIAGKKNSIKYVSVQWALDSMAVEKRLPESRFSVLNLHQPNQKSLGLMFPGAGNKGCGSSS